MKAFQLGNYGEAIRLWNELDAEANPWVRAAISEAHFRRALTARLPEAEAISALRSAIDLFPNDARYWYHLGLMSHRHDDLEEARNAYASAADLGLKRQGIGFVRGLVELEIDPRVSLDTLLWLTPETRTALSPIAELLREVPKAAPTRGVRPPAPKAPNSVVAVNSPLASPVTSPVVSPVVSLWKGLALLASGDASGAYTALTPPKGQRLPISAEPIRAFYFGVAAAIDGRPQEALSIWRDMARVTSLGGASRPAQLNAYISQTSAHSILALQKEGRWEEALKEAQSALLLAPDDTWLFQATLIAANRLATKARDAGDWPRAIARWGLMREILESHPRLGALAPILHNLAIAHEALEEWEEAARAWVALLGSLPRRGARTSKKATTGAEGPSSDEQRGWIRRRILDNFQRAELPDEAITYYKQAVKSDPENLELRLEMASALHANEQTIAARNEVQRILDKDPKRVDAWLLQAEIHRDRDEFEKAEQSLRRVLEIDPKHESARKAVNQIVRERGMDAFNSGRYLQAYNIYTEALKDVPDDPQILVFLGQTELVLGRAKNAQAHFDAALATGKPQAYTQMFSHWGRRENEEEARKILQRARDAGLATSDLYIQLGILCLTDLDKKPDPSQRPGPLRGLPKPQAASFWAKWGRELIAQGLDSAPDRAEALTSLIAALGPEYAAIVVVYAQELVALRPDEPEIYLNLAFFQGVNGDFATAKKTLSQAERIAQKQGRKDMLAEIANLRKELASPMFGMLKSLIASGLNPFDMDDN